MGMFVARAAVATLTAVLVLSGCEASEQVVADVKLRDLTNAENIVVERAEALLIKQCMEGAGFRYWLGPIASLEQRKGNGYVLEDVEWARRYGYGRKLDEQVEELARTDPNIAYVKTLSAPEAIRYERALDGRPED